MKKTYFLMVCLLALAGITKAQNPTSGPVAWATLYNQDGVTIEWQLYAPCNGSQAIGFRLANTSETPVTVRLKVPENVNNQPGAIEGYVECIASPGLILQGQCGTDPMLGALVWTLKPETTFTPQASDIVVASGSKK